MRAMCIEYGKALAGVCWLLGFVAFGNWSIDGLGPKGEQQAFWAMILLGGAGLIFWLLSHNYRQEKQTKK